MKIFPPQSASDTLVGLKKIALFDRGMLIWIIPLIILSGCFIFRAFDFSNGEWFYTLNDDAMISMRYAKHLASGYGFVFNINEPAVEGFTNLLWMLYMALHHLIFGSGIYACLALSLTAIGQLVLIGALVANLAQQITGVNNPQRYCLSFLCATEFGVLFWSLRGMETGTVVLLTLYGTIALSRIYAYAKQSDVWRLSIASSLLLLTRPDSAVIVLIFIACCIILSHEKHRLSIFLIAVIPPFLIQICLVAFRVNIFGDYFPNTFYLKIGGVSTYERFESGVSLLLQFSMTYVGLIIASIGVFIVSVRQSWPKNLSCFIAFAALMCISLVLYSLYAGGDFAEAEGGPNRFLLPGIPLALTALWISLERAHLAEVRMYIIAISFFVLVSGSSYWLWVKRNAPMVISDLDRARLGLFIKDALSTNLSFAGHAAGNTPYWSDRKFFDLLGKTDAYIARSTPTRAFAPGHNKWNYAYSIGVLKPDLIIDPFRDTTFFGDLSYEIRVTDDYANVRPAIWIRKSTVGINIEILKLIPQFRSIAID